eukprot:Partr_v1_DN27651_c3_g1_i4_m65044 putative chloride channel
MLNRITGHYEQRLHLLDQHESLILEPADGVIVKANSKLHNGANGNDLGRIGRLVVVILIGAVVGAAYSAMHAFAEFIMEVSVHHHEYFPGRSMAAIMVPSMIFSVMIALSASLLVFYEPAAGGPGMPELMAYLNGSGAKSAMNLRVAVIKLMGITAIVSAGLKSGYDGPFAHFGMIISILILNAVKIGIKTGGRFWAKPVPDTALDNQQDNLIFGVAGAAAGVAAAFSAPLGGVLFAMEEAMSYFHPSLLFQTLCASVVAFLFKGLSKVLESRKDAFSLESLSFLELTATCQFPFPLFHLLTFTMFGLVIGVLGHLFNSLVILVVRFKRKYLFPRPYLRLFEVVVICVLTSLANHGIPELFDSCVPYGRQFEHMDTVARHCPVTCKDVTSGLFSSNVACRTAICLPTVVREEFEHELSPVILEVRAQCENNKEFKLSLTPDGLDQFYVPEYFVMHDEDNRCFFPLRTLFSSLPHHTLDVLFARGRHHFFSARDLAIYGAFYTVLALLTYYIMLPSDLVVPSLIIGAVIGRLFGRGLNSIIQPLGYLPSDPGAFAILGSMTFWASSSQMAVAVAVIAIESTLDLNILPALVICLIVSQIVARNLGESQYHQELHVLGFPFLAHVPPKPLTEQTAADMMIHDCVCITENIPVEELKRILETSHNGFPVVRSYNGNSTIMRPSEGESFSDAATLDASRQRVIGIAYRDQLENALKEMNISIDIEAKDAGDISGRTVYLSEFMISPPVTIQPDMIASKAFIMFRRMGLRHLMVVDNEQCLLGLLTRAEFTHGHSH